MPKTDAKTRILKAGARIVHRKGFLDTGLTEVLQAARVPKGSFYFHFESKEAFGLQLIDYFADFLREIQGAVYRDERLTHIERIRRIFELQAESFCRNGYEGGCPIGNLALEMGDRNPRFRERLKRIFDELKANLADQLKKARDRGEIGFGFDPDETAGFILNSWEGALMQMKICRTTQPHKTFDRMMFQHLLNAPGPRRTEKEAP